MPVPVALESQPIAVRFGAPSTGCHAAGGAAVLDLAMPVLAGADCETLGFFEPGEGWESGRHGDFFLARGNGWLAGCVARATQFPMEGAALDLYRDLLDVVGEGKPIYRIWNYLPDINGETDGLENYRWFNLGRHRAYHERYDGRMAAHISAASAVGMGGDKIALAFIAGDRPARAVENPEQVPAHCYPADYGPKSPSFTRGATAQLGGGETAFLSGTSSIKGHETVGEGDFELQFATTIENIRLVAERMGCPTAVSPSSPLRRHFKFYLRNADDLPRARELFAGAVGERAAAQTVYLKADICRSDLALEIEGIFSEARAAAG